MSTSAQSIVIHGPQGCGKTVNAQRLRRHFGLAQVHDDGTGEHPPLRWNKPLPAGTLVLCIDPPPAGYAERYGVRVIPFKEAMRLAGFARTATH